MELDDYIGFKFVDVKPFLDKNGYNYKIVEVFDTKNTKMGNELRIINIKYDNKETQIYVAYF
jgi:hypothetical protein